MSLCLRNLSIRSWSPFLASSLSRYCFLGGNLVLSLRENWLNISGLSRNSDHAQIDLSPYSSRDFY